MALIDELKERADKLDAEMLALSGRIKEIERESDAVHICINALDIAEMDEEDAADADLDTAIAALEAPAQLSELRDAPPAAEEGSGDQLTAQQMTPEQIEAFLAADKNGGNQSEDFTLLDPAVLRDEPEIPEGWMPVTSDDCPADPHSLVEVIAKHGLITYATQPVVAGEVMWEFQRAYRIVKPAPLIDAQTCEEIDPRVSWKAEPEILEGFTKWEGGNDPVTTEDSEGYMDGPIVEVIYRDGVRTEGPSWTYIWSHEYSDSSQHIIAYRIISPEAEPGTQQGALIDTSNWQLEGNNFLAEQEAEAEPETEGYAPVVDAEPNPIDAAVEKGAITQDEADLLAAAKAELEEGSTARMFAEGMMADADRYQSDQRSIVEKIGGLFKREREDA